MKYDEVPRTPPSRVAEMVKLGANLKLLRKALGITQAHAAERAGISRTTAALIEAGDGSRTMLQILRYLHGLSPDAKLADLMKGDHPTLNNLQAKAVPQRIRQKKLKAQDDYDF